MQNVINENLENHHVKQTKSVKITIKATMSVDLEYSETLEVPNNITDEELNLLHRDFHESVDGGNFSEIENSSSWVRGCDFDIQDLTKNS